LILPLLLASAPLWAAPEPDEKVLLRQARGEAGYIAAALREESEGFTETPGDVKLAGPGGDARLGDAFDKLLARLGRLKGDRKVSDSMQPVVERLIELVRSYPQFDYAKSDPGGLTRALARQLEFSAEQASKASAVPAATAKALSLPQNLSGLPTNLTLAQFKALGPVVIFLLKTRSSEPAGYADIDLDALKDNAYHVEIGVRARFTVDSVSDAEDGDYCFRNGGVESEITPHRRGGDGLCHPEVGDLVEVEGWSYYDSFHGDELPAEQEKTKGRHTLWEIHPVIRCRIIRRADAR
jgi:hypothetical protein